MYELTTLYFVNSKREKQFWISEGGLGKITFDSNLTKPLLD